MTDINTATLIYMLNILIQYIDTIIDILDTTY